MMFFTSMWSLFKKACTVFVSLGANKLVYLLLTIVMARKIGVKGVGAYGFVLALAGLFFVITGIGHGVAVREIASDVKNVSKYFWNFITLKSIISIIAFGLVAITMQFYPTNAEVKIAAYLYSVFLFLEVLPNGAIAVFQALQRFKLYTTMIVINDVSVTITAICFLLLGKGLLGVMLGFIVGGLFSCGLSIVLLLRTSVNLKLFRIDFELWKRFIRRGVYFLMQKIFQQGMFQADILVLSIFGNLAVIGIYQAAYKISFSASIISFATAFVMYPLYSAHFTKSSKFLKKDYFQTMFCNLILAIFMYLILVLFSSIVVYYIYGPDFLAAVQIIKILALAIAIHALNQNNLSFLNAVRQEKLNFCLIALTFIVNAIFDIILIKPYGIKGVATATVFCALAYFITSTTLILKYNKDKRLKVHQNY